ncbi:hypothetical protein HF521_002422 [Silurus meridionalis]|uniref:G-protein coupled receptors family 1 profile domain-containing protein n=1 Tax=Silurus meridionalis TaxID=175797 RepID=A0A8T0B7P4_SILME|nr:hypothetical protein HF521_002422 [Silurus meridionalis]
MADALLERGTNSNSSSNQTGFISTARLSCSNDESYKYIILPLCYSLTFLLSVGLNSTVLLRSYRGGRRWNSSLIYMVNLASTDLMYSLSLPLLVASYVMHDNWVFGDFMCRLVRFLFYFNLYCSIFFLTCISVHRYMGICHPIKTITLESKRAAKSTCAMVWVVVFLLTCPIFRFAQTGDMPRVDGRGTNTTTESGINHVVRTIFQTLHTQSHVQQVGDNERGPTNQISIAGTQHALYISRRRKSIKTIATITFLFALCFLPFHITRTLYLILKQRNAECRTIHAISVCYKVTRPLASFNSWLNALLYFVTGDNGISCCGLTENTHHTHHVWPSRALGGLKKEVEAEKREQSEQRTGHDQKRDFRPSGITQKPGNVSKPCAWWLSFELSVSE